MSRRTIDAMTDAEKASLVAELDSKTPVQHLAESKPLTRSQRERFKRWQKRFDRQADRRQGR